MCINHNADALSRVGVTGVARPGTSVPETVQGAVANAETMAQHAISTSPEPSIYDLIALQEADPAISPVILFCQQWRMPNHIERQGLHPVALGLRSVGSLSIRRGLLHWTYQRPDGGECVYQLVLPQSLWEDLFQQLHTHHGHQGTECTIELIRQRCYWPGMGKTIIGVKHVKDSVLQNKHSHRLKLL